MENCGSTVQYDHCTQATVPMNMEPASPNPPPAVAPSPTGLSSAEAARRLKSDGFNELPGQKARSWPLILVGVVKEPMFALMLGAAFIYFIVGSLSEALTLTASIGVVILISVFQERRTDHTLAMLKDLSSPRALVVRDGVETRIPGREVVVGDLVLLREGDRVPADGDIVSATGLSVDESIITGESLSVDKAPGSAGHVFASTLVVTGFGTMQVTATGARSEIGRIGTVLGTLKPETTPLFREVHGLVRWIAAAGLGLCALVAVVYGLTRGNWLQGVLAGITLAMGVLPEEFPVVLTVFLAMGAWRISKRGVLTRRMPAIETIGSTTVLAVDKTGTITENRMRVALIETASAKCDLREADATTDAAAGTVLGIALAASERSAFDPMERAIHEAAAKYQPDAVAELEQRQLVREYDLTPELLAVTHVWRGDRAETHDVAVKGAPEAVFGLCKLPAAERERWLSATRAHALEGLRVLGVARGQFRGAELPDSPQAFALEFLGLLCLADPVRATVPAALAECRAAGIRVVMITGDHPGTALAIAGQASLDTKGGVLTGDEIASLSDEALAARVKVTNLYARTKPEQKLRLIQAFKAAGEVTVMTGDGVNDAPALKAAHVGVAMGSRGTDVAREAAALVLVNDDFASLVGAVRIGRRIYDNIQHAMSYLLAVHIPIAGMGLLPVLFGWPLVLYPLHVLFLEFVIDPACSLVFEADPEHANVMERKPRRATARLFSKRTVFNSVVMGTAALAYSVGVYALGLELFSENEARSLGFMAMVVANLLLIFVARAQGEDFRATLVRPNRLYWGITGVTLTALLLAMYIPAIEKLFGFDAPPVMATGGVLLAAVMVLLPAAMFVRQRRASAAE
jgi:Ca2+-transporting ATPase